MLGFFLDDAKDAGWRFASCLTARDWGSQDPAVGIVDSNPLAAQRNDCHNWLAARSRVLNGRDLSFLPTACGVRKIARRDQRSQARDGNMNTTKPNRFVLRDEKTTRHPRPLWSGSAESRDLKSLPTPTSFKCRIVARWFCWELQQFSPAMSPRWDVI